MDDDILAGVAEDWQIVLRVLPSGWQDKARELGALRRHREFSDAATLLRVADSDEAGRVFRFESGHPFRFESGHPSDLKAAGVASPDRSSGVVPQDLFSGQE